VRKLLATVLLLAACPAMAAIQARPNILLLMAEDMSSRVGAFGDPVAVTPNIDALAGQGVRYTHTFTTAGVCAPSRAAHILGMHQISTGTQHMRSSAGGYFAVPPPDVKAYPELLRTAGYHTFTDEKLDYQFSGVRAGSGPFTIWDAENTTDWSGREPGQPFFGFINFQVTHESGVFTPLGAMPQGWTHLVLQVMRHWKLGSVETGVVKPESVLVEPYYPDIPTVRTDIARHYDNIAHMDGEVGRILQRLEEEGLSDSTIVIWTTDHGDGLPRAKRELFDSGIRVPMVIRWPEAYRPAGVVPGEVDSRLISFVDLAPTILRLAGVAPPDYLQGQDFVAPGAPARQYVYASRDRIDEVVDRQRAVRDDRLKYIRSWYPELPGGHPLVFRENLDMAREMQSLYQAGQLNAAQAAWFSPPGEERLFDLRNDPFELVDVSEDPAFHEDLLRMRSALDSWLDRVPDWSDVSEAELKDSFYLGGERPQTPPPGAHLVDGAVMVEPAGPGTSIGYRVDDGDWSLYSGPIEINGDNKIEVRAVRYGWKASDIVEPEP
jgi:arylsulfatase A-like enzyme